MKRLIVILTIVLIPTISWGWEDRRDIYELERKLERIQEQLDLQDAREQQRYRDAEWGRRNREFDERYEGSPEWLREWNRKWGYDRPQYPK